MMQGPYRSMGSLLAELRGRSENKHLEFDEQTPRWPWFFFGTPFQYEVAVNIKVGFEALNVKIPSKPRVCRLLAGS